MTDRSEITEAMIKAAADAGKASGALAPGARHDDIRKILSCALAMMTIRTRGPRYDLWVNTSITTKKARFLGTTEQRAYFRVETEDGKILTVHGNDIQPSRGPGEVMHKLRGW